MTERAKIKKDDVLICLEDYRDLKQGDRVTVVVPMTPCCGGFVAKGHVHHYDPKFFDVFSGGEISSVEIGCGIPEEQIMNVFDRLFVALAVQNQNNWVATDSMTTELFIALERLGLKEKFLASR